MYSNTEIKMPCYKVVIDDKGKAIGRHPLVECEGKCATCGWNPQVAEARLRKAGWEVGEK